jgi:osmotically-inducible protein OsmY
MLQNASWRILAMKKLAGLITAAGLVVTVACAQTDAGITTKVKSQLAADDTVKAYQVDVDTSNKVVTLRGDVETVAQKEQAVAIARNTEGVRDVIDQLRVNPTAATTGLDDIGNDRDDPNIGDDIEAGARKAGEAAKEGAKKTGDAVKDVFTDKDRDSDNDGK